MSTHILRMSAFLTIAVALSCTNQMVREIDILVTNARIFDGRGGTFERAFVVIDDGRIKSVSADRPNAVATVEIDATGMTVMPGLIDTHCHLLAEADSAEAMDRWMDENIQALLSDYLANGFTTIMSLGDYFPAILDVRQRLEDGAIAGPRLLATGPTFAAPDGWPLPLYRLSAWSREHGVIEAVDPGALRRHVRELEQAGVDGLKVTIDRTIVPGAVLSDDVLDAIVEEAQTLNVSVFVHASTVEDTVNAALHGADRLVHTPFNGLISADVARQIRDAEIAVATTVSFGSPEFDSAVGRERQPERAESHARRLENIRLLWDASVTVAFGTDSPPRIDFMAEVRALSNVLTPEEIVTALTSNAAEFLNLSDEIGTVEPGKVADLLIVDGNPLSSISDLTKVAAVIKNGDVVVDNRK